MNLQLIEFDGVAAQPWRNGGGQTRELLAWPDAADWLLRVSVADIERDGPFSAFPGVQRWFAVLQGAGVALALPGAPLELTPESPPCGFDGEDAPGCRLLAGPTRDLNLMSRRQHGEAQMRRASPLDPLPAGPTWRGLFTAGPATLLVGDTETALPAFTLAWSTQSTDAWRLAPAAAPARAWWLAFTRAPGSRPAPPSETPT